MGGSLVCASGRAKQEGEVMIRTDKEYRHSKTQLSKVCEPGTAQRDRLPCRVLLHYRSR